MSENAASQTQLERGNNKVTLMNNLLTKNHHQLTFGNKHSHQYEQFSNIFKKNFHKILTILKFQPSRLLFTTVLNKKNISFVK